jgi:hypothetical protein
MSDFPNQLTQGFREQPFLRKSALIASSDAGSRPTFARHFL